MESNLKKAVPREKNAFETPGWRLYRANIQTCIRMGSMPRRRDDLELKKLRNDLRGMIRVRQHKLDTWPRESNTIPSTKDDERGIDCFVRDPMQRRSMAALELILLIEHEIDVLTTCLERLQGRL